MADMYSKDHGSGGSQSGSSAAGSPSSAPLSGQVPVGATQVKQQAADLVDQAKQQIGEQASGLMDSAKEMAGKAGDKLLGAVNEQKSTGADYVSEMADALRKAAQPFESAIPQAAPYIRRAADQIDTMADALKRRDLNDIVGEIQSFARRQPTVFFGATLLAGFAAVRFLKSNSAARPSSSGGGQPQSWGSGGRERVMAGGSTYPGTSVGSHGTPSAVSHGNSTPSGGQTRTGPSGQTTPSSTAGSQAGVRHTPRDIQGGTGGSGVSQIGGSEGSSYKTTSGSSPKGQGRS